MGDDGTEREAYASVREWVDGWGAEVARVALVVKQDEVADPVHVRLFGATAAVANTQGDP